MGSGIPKVAGTVRNIKKIVLFHLMLHYCNLDYLLVHVTVSGGVQVI